MTKLKRIFMFILIPVLLTTWGEFILKATINSLSFDQTYTPTYFDRIVDPLFPDTPFFHSFTTQIHHFEVISTHKKVLLAIFLIVLGGCIWMIAMSKFALSFLYPFLSINYLLVIAGSQLWLGEKVSVYRYLSVMLIMMGLFLISKSPNSEK